MIIEEGSIVKFKIHGIGSDDIIKICTASKDIEVQPNVVTLINGGLYCTDSATPVEKEFGEYIVNVWLQDAYYVEENMFYESISDAD